MDGAIFISELTFLDDASKCMFPGLTPGKILSPKGVDDYSIFLLCTVWTYMLATSRLLNLIICNHLKIILKNQYSILAAKRNYIT